MLKVWCLNVFVITASFAFFHQNCFSVEYLEKGNNQRQESEKYQKRKNEEMSVIVGKKFWYLPHTFPISHLNFLDGIPGPTSSIKGEFSPTAETDFVITGWEGPSGYGYLYYKVRFPDGREGYIETKEFDRRLAESEDIDPTTLMDRIYIKDPEILRRNQQQRQAVAEKESIVRGGVKIGMNTVEVLRSNWGKPYSVNKTTTVDGITEQWVYGEKTYLLLQKWNTEKHTELVLSVMFFLKLQEAVV